MSVLLSSQLNLLFYFITLLNDSKRLLLFMNFSTRKYMIFHHGPQWTRSMLNMHAVSEGNQVKAGNWRMRLHGICLFWFQVDLDLGCHYAGHQEARCISCIAATERAFVMHMHTCTWFYIADIELRRPNSLNPLHWFEKLGVWFTWSPINQVTAERQ